MNSAPPLLVRRWRWRGIVQGVGFRPAVVRLARAAGLRGWVRNTPDGVEALVAGPADILAAGPAAWAEQLPPAAHVERCDDEPWADSSSSPPFKFDPAELFTIRPSVGGTDARPPSLAPDLELCPDCRAEIADPASRRHRYAFTSCAGCGPRFSVLEALPFDRERTTLRDFPLCPSCASEYTDPADRRYHAQAMTCPACGPRLSLHAGGVAFAATDMAPLARDDDALRQAAVRLRTGEIGAVLGLGGFHLMVRADDAAAVARLRARKRRPAKPLALMVADLAAARRLAHVDDTGAALLASPAAPIVLLRPRDGAPVAEGVAPDVPTLGLMLAATPLHVRLLAEVGAPLVATSGNLAEEPICTDRAQARARLAPVADFFLLHDRRVARPLDDSVARVIASAPVWLRRGRGLAPAPLALRLPGAPDLLAAGGQMKSAFALAVGGQVLPSQHFGELDDPLCRDAFAAGLADYHRLFRPGGAPFAALAVDPHPDYAATPLARAAASTVSPVVTIPVQHHHAHAAAVAAEHGLERALAVVWDGTGLGDDGDIWGGEWLELLPGGRFRRVAWLRRFRLPGGEAAVREPARCAVGALLAAGLGDALDESATAARLGVEPARLATLRALAASPRLSRRTSSAGRLFDAAAALLGLAPARAYEAQAALALEARAERAPASAAGFPRCVVGPGPAPGTWEVDWAPLLPALLAATDVAAAAAAFHLALADAATDVARRVGLPDVVLAGGCFQNAFLAEALVARLRAAGLRPRLPREVPPNDGGLAVGQLVVAAARLAANTGAANADAAAGPVSPSLLPV